MVGGEGFDGNRRLGDLMVGGGGLMVGVGV